MKKETFKLTSLKISSGQLKEATYSDDKYIIHKVTPPKGKEPHPDFINAVKDLKPFFHGCLNTGLSIDDLDVKGFGIKEKDDYTEIHFTGVMFCRDAKPVGLSTPGYDIDELHDINKENDIDIKELTKTISNEAYDFIFGTKQSGQQEMEID